MISTHEVMPLSIASTLVFVGFAAMVAGAVRWRARDRSPLWFGLFSTLYGVRLLVTIGALSAAAGLSEPHARLLGDAITYAIVTPACLLAASLWGRRSVWLRRLWRLDLAYAAIAIGIDVSRGRPGSMMWLNAPAVAANLLAVLVVAGAGIRASRWTPGTVAATAGLGAFLVFAGMETFGTGTGRLWPGVPLEPLGMLAFVWGLGMMVAERSEAGERRLAAMSQELETARRIQRSILPAGPPRVPGVTVAARVLPVTEVAGDFYDCLVAADAVGILVADVAGHGVPAALVASMVKIALASQAEHVRDPGALLTRLNRALSGTSDIPFITAVYACVDLRGQRLVYASAGHPAPLLRRASGQVESLGESGLVLCVAQDTVYESAAVTLGPGDCVVLYTDGLTEAEAPGGAFFGEERLVASFGRSGGSEPEAVVDSLLREVRDWGGGARRELADDVTVVAVRYAGAPAAARLDPRTPAT